MKKNDKLIVIIGAIILILASVGLYFAPTHEIVKELQIRDFEGITGKLKDVPEAITVSDNNPFYPLIATPIAVHYNSKGEQELIPLFVENMESPSNTIVRMKEYLYIFSQEKVDGSLNEKEVSLELAERYWKSSDAALIIENSQAGYELGVIATPIASYLSVPVIVTDEIDSDVTRVLANLGVEKTIICGENLEPTGKYLKLKTVENAVDATIEVVDQKFIKTGHIRDIDYITLTNPIDAFPPEVLDSEEFYFGPDTIKSKSFNRKSVGGAIANMFLPGSSTTWEFKIPDDYKYALIEFEGYNHELDGVDEFDDYAEFVIDPVDREAIFSYPKTKNAMAKRDGAGNIIEDKLYLEMVFYDCGGDTFKITASGGWTLLDEGKVSATVKVHKLDNPVYELMGGLSSIAPYLTANYKGIVFGSTDFAFTADDDVIITDGPNRGKTCPGYYLAGRNIDLVPLSNRHVIDNIHQPLNELLAKLADIPYGAPRDLEHLTSHYNNNPVHIAIVGGSTVIPRYIYENEVGPIGYEGFQGFAGGGTPTDNIYANIDPVKYDNSNMATDIYSPTGYPYLENIVGRITGWDVQDANALILRSLFYEEILETLSEWKYNFGNLYGGGIDFRAPWPMVPFRLLTKIPVIGGLVPTSTTLNIGIPPWKIDTGYSQIFSQALEYKVGEKLGFNVNTALHEEAMLGGFSDEALEKIKTTTLWNRLTYDKSQIRELAGEGNVKGREIMENSNLIWLTGHGSPYGLGLEGSDLVSSGASGLIRNGVLYREFYKRFISPYFMAGFWGPGTDHKGVGEYLPRKTATIEMGPSVLWLESCFTGKMTGVTPQANVGQGILHAGVSAMVASTCGSNIAGGYLPGKSALADTGIGTWLRLREWQNKAEQDIYPDLHLGGKIYEDMTSYLSEGLTVGDALRNAKNQYLPEDADWELWWSPPLSSLNTDAPEPALGYDTHMGPKYSSFNMYQLYGDPAFKPFIPLNN